MPPGPSLSKKTNAARILDSLGIDYRLLAIEVGPDDLSAETAARQLGLPQERVYKTLLLRGDRHGLLEALIPAGREIDLKALALASGNKKTEMCPLRELLPLTGYQRGGCSPIGGRRDYPVYILDEITRETSVAVNAGARGLMFLLSPGDLIRVTKAALAPIAALATDP
jgi:Cys-tRNA(Pro)/Cys-tRNA(Cys) deacylase